MMKNDLIDMLLDPNNRDDLVLYTVVGQRLVFEQIATIPYQDNLYAVLRPLDEELGLDPDEVIVFKVDVDGDEAVIYPEEDEAVYTAVYQVYRQLLEEEE